MKRLQLERMKTKFLTIIALIFAAQTVFGQQFTISGYIRDKNSGEELIGANIYFNEIKKGTVSNHFGYYSISYEKGQYTLVVSFLGYETFRKSIHLEQNQKLNILLSPTEVSAAEVTILGEKTDKNVSGTQMGTVKMPVKQIKNLPVLFGEVDILKSIQLLPGVQSANEGSTGLYVRGGGPDQNLILLDGATVYNAAHLFGFFSVFNADAIKDVELIKGGMPAQYGGRLSSVLDISMKEGNMKEYHLDGGIGLIASRLTLEGPIKKDTSSFIISGRRTYIDLLAKPFISDSSMFNGSGYYFYDLNAKINYRFSDKDRLYLSGYFGRDVFNFKNKDSDYSMSIPWGNTTGTLRWNHVFNDKLFLNTTYIYSDYQFDVDIVQDDFELKLFSGITSNNLNFHFSYFPNINHKIHFGADFARNCFVPSSVSVRTDESNIDIGDRLKQYANDIALFFNDDFDLTERVKISAGLRATLFQQVGPFTRYLKDDEGNFSDTITYNKGDKVVQFQHLEPRLSVRYQLSKNSSFKASYTQNYQYLHMASLSSLVMPTDLWVPSSDVVMPQFGVQYSVGYFKNFSDNQYESSVEVYYKSMEHQIEYIPGSTPSDNVGDNADNNFTFGQGESYGIEFFVKKNYGKVSGWIGYTLSETTKQFPEINQGIKFPAKYDRRHDLSIITSYQISDKWSISAVFVFASGNTFTPVLGRYFMDNGTIVTEYGDYNSYRIKDYHRLDLSINYKHISSKKFESGFNFSVYNVYNRHNPYIIYFDYEGDITQGQLQTFAKQVTIFPIMPSISWNFAF